jgi:hypothetical protein
MRHQLIVRTIRIAMVSLLAIAWVLLTSHCRIEAVPGFEFLSCANETLPSSTGGDPCDDAGCCSLESAQFHAPRQQEETPLSIFALKPCQASDVVEAPSFSEITLVIPIGPPPEASTCWRFHSRTALPPRPPSFVS